MAFEVRDDANGPSVLDIARRLVAVPSPQTELLEAEPRILRYLDECVVPLLAEVGLRSRRDAMGNVIVEIGPTDATRSLLVMGYAMTHPAAAMEDPYSARIVERPDGPALRGRGVCEQKGALAAAIWAASHLAGDPRLAGRLAFVVSTAGETGRHIAAEAALAELERLPRLGILAIGTGNRITLGNKGRIDLTITVRGRAAHSSSPWMAIDAIQGAREVMDRLEGLALPDTEHPALGRVSLTPTHIRSWPEATHTVQDEVQLTYDRRLLPGEDADAALVAIEAALQDVPPWRVTVERGPFMLPSEVAEDAAVVRTIQRGVARAGHEPVATFYTHGGLDGGYLNASGCETVMWGPGDVEEWHTDDEQVLVSDLEQAAACYLGVLTDELTGEA